MFKYKRLYILPTRKKIKGANKKVQFKSFQNI